MPRGRTPPPPASTSAPRPGTGLPRGFFTAEHKKLKGLQTPPCYPKRYQIPESKHIYEILFSSSALSHSLGPWGTTRAFPAGKRCCWCSPSREPRRPPSPGSPPCGARLPRPCHGDRVGKPRCAARGGLRRQLCTGGVWGGGKAHAAPQVPAPPLHPKPHRRQPQIKPGAGSSRGTHGGCTEGDAWRGMHGVGGCTGWGGCTGAAPAPPPHFAHRHRRSIPRTRRW